MRDLSVTRKVWVTFDRVGWHRYPNAPDDVAYLKLEHRHKFKFKVGVSVTHDDREIEFHQLLNWLESLYDERLVVNHKSCEMLASDLIDSLVEKYGIDRHYEVEVSEDGECGAVLTTFN